MLVRLPSSLSSAVTHQVKRLPSYTRCNSTGTPTSPDDTVPKKRAIPLVEHLGDVNISNPRRHGGQDQKRGGNMWSHTAGNGGKQRQNLNGNGGQRHRNGDQSQRQDSRNHRHTNGVPRSQSSAPSVANATSTSQSGELQVKNEQSVHDESSEQTRPARVAHSRVNARAEAQSRRRVAIPDPKEIELSNLDELFKSPVLQSSLQPVNAVPTNITPSQARTQLLLERTAGDYSRYTPKYYPSTDVEQLGSVGLAGFVLSRKRDVGLRARQHALAVVQKFASGDKKAQASS